MPFADGDKSYRNAPSRNRKETDQMKITRMKLSDMRKPEKNVRMHTEMQLQEYERSIKMFGQIRPIVVDGEGTILAGIGLYETLNRMQKQEADVYCLENLTPAQKKKLMIADNRIFNLGVENLDVLNEFIEELKDDLDIPGFDEEILRQMVSDAEEVTEKICEYGTLDEDEIHEIKQTGERQQAMYKNEAVMTEKNMQTQARSASDSEPLHLDHEIPEPEGKFVICPDCGRKIWL